MVYTLSNAILFCYKETKETIMPPKLSFTLNTSPKPISKRVIQVLNSKYAQAFLDAIMRERRGITDHSSEITVTRIGSNNKK